MLERGKLGAKLLAAQNQPSSPQSPQPGTPTFGADALPGAMRMSKSQSSDIASLRRLAAGSDGGQNAASLQRRESFTQIQHSVSNGDNTGNNGDNTGSNGDNIGSNGDNTGNRGDHSGSGILSSETGDIVPNMADKDEHAEDQGAAISGVVEGGLPAENQVEAAPVSEQRSALPDEGNEHGASRSVPESGARDSPSSDRRQHELDLEAEEEEELDSPALLHARLAQYRLDARTSAGTGMHMGMEMGSAGGVGGGAGQGRSAKGAPIDMSSVHSIASELLEFREFENT